VSPVRELNPSADALKVCRRQHLVNRYGEGYEGSAGSETPRMHGNFLHGNREALYLASGEEGRRQVELIEVCQKESGRKNATSSY
jgi:hypothetical protein